MRLTWDSSHPDGGLRATRKVAVVGLGVVSVVGIGKDQFWKGLFKSFPAGVKHVEDFDPSPWLNPKELRRYDRFNQFGIAAADLAMKDAGSLNLPSDKVGVFMGTGVGGLESLENQIILAQTRGYNRVSPFLVPLLMTNAGAASIAMRFELRGPCETTSTACASSNHAIANAAHLIATGRCDAMLAGGQEAAITPAATAGFTNMTAISSCGISRPFDKARDGFVQAEGAGVLVLEEYEHAISRGAHIYALIEGTASNEDAYHITAPLPGGKGAEACMRLALDDAGITPTQITHINAHGTSTPLNDLSESQAIYSIFGDDCPPVTSVKGTLGHALGSAGALEAIAVALTYENGMIPVTANTKEVDSQMKIDLVTDSPRKFESGYVISNSFGFGGHNSCLVFGPAR